MGGWISEPDGSDTSLLYLQSPFSRGVSGSHNPTGQPAQWGMTGSHTQLCWHTGACWSGGQRRGGGLAGRANQLQTIQTVSSCGQVPGLLHGDLDGQIWAREPELQKDNGESLYFSTKSSPF